MPRIRGPSRQGKEGDRVPLSFRERSGRRSTRWPVVSMLPFILMASSGIPVLSPGQPMPVLKGEFLTGRQAVLPDAAAGRLALLALGFTYDSRFAVEAWIGRFRKDCGD